jgi:hypothetical protein
MQVEIHVLFSAFEHRFNNVLQKDGFSILYICPKVNVDGATFDNLLIIICQQRECVQECDFEVMILRHGHGQLQ